MEIKITIFREEAKSALAGFHASSLSWSKSNLVSLVFLEGGKPENPEKTPYSKARANDKFNMAPGRNRARATYLWEASALIVAASLLPVLKI